MGLDLPTWAQLINYLAQRLIGKEWPEVTASSKFDPEERHLQIASELAALESMYPSVNFIESESAEGLDANTAYVNISIPSTPLVLHMILPDTYPYPMLTAPPLMYISSEPSSTRGSNTAPPYIRLHLLSTVLMSPLISERGDGEAIGLVAASTVEEEWLRVQNEGPPEIEDVLKHLLLELPQVTNSNELEILSPAPRPKYTQKGTEPRPLDDRSDPEIVRDFEKTRGSQEYQSLKLDRQRLPAWTCREQVLSALKSSQVVVCVGETGSGKTTQIPQFILDNYLDNAKRNPSKSTLLRQMQIIVTQPRRVAAISVASRVSAERANDGSVAYTIRGESSASRRTKLLFCTTGVALRRLTVGDGLKGVNVIMIDEVGWFSFYFPFIIYNLVVGP